MTLLCPYPLNHFQGNPAADGFLLLGHIHHPATPHQPLEQFVAPIQVPGPSSVEEWVEGYSEPGPHVVGGDFHEVLELRLRFEECLDALTPLRIPGARLVQVGRALGRSMPQRGRKDRFSEMGFGVFTMNTDWAQRGICGEPESLPLAGMNVAVFQ